MRYFISSWKVDTLPEPPLPKGDLMTEGTTNTSPRRLPDADGAFPYLPLRRPGNVL